MAFKKLFHSRSHRNFSCEFCNEQLPTPDDMRVHLFKCGSKTDLCPVCNKHIRRSVFAYHKDNNCSNPDFSDGETESTPSELVNTSDKTASSNTIGIRNSKTLESLREKVIHVQESLSEVCYSSEIDHVAEKLQFNIVIIGSPRVGKSELINALCNGKNRAETSLSLNSCTKEVQRYVLEDHQQNQTSDVRPFTINFYDTPGIESWNNQGGETTMIQFIEQTNPVCVVYCASPGSFAKLEQLHSVLEYCKSKEIFCALVCTNMWSGNNRTHVMAEFERELNFFGEKVEKFSPQFHSKTPHKVTFFGKNALCTMVNSKEYYDPDFSDQRKPVQGIDELIQGIMEALDDEKLLGWCYAVLYRRTYWEKISQNITGFFSLRLMDIYRLKASTPERTANNLLTYLNEWIFKKKDL